MAVPEVLLSPAARERLMQGFNTLARLLAITLGPTQRSILSTSYQSRTPEALGDAATIARRFVALPGQAENVGAMLLRNLVWQQHERAGDGCATAAVLGWAMLAAGHRYIAAGVDPLALRRGIDRAVDMACEALRREARLPQDEEDIERVALSICGDERLSLLIAELFTLLGPDASIAVESYSAPYLDREYLEGGRWKARLASPYLASKAAGELVGPTRAVLHEGYVALFAGSVRSLDDVRPLLEQVARSEHQRLLLAAHDFADPALTTLVVNHQRGLVQVVAAELREAGVRRRQDFEDLAALTGARLFAEDCGDRLRDVDVEALGRIRRAEATDHDLSVSGARGSALVRAQVAALRARFAMAENETERSEWSARLARMAHGTAILKIGAASDPERHLLRQRAEQCIRAMPLAMHEGVVPGGGTALLRAADTIAELAMRGGEEFGQEIVRHALAAPFRQIVANVGKRDPSAVLAELRRQGADWLYDGLADAVLPAAEVGLLDSVGVLCEALRAAASGAAMALTTEALVLKRAPETSFAP